jgi:hypothetical protein
VSYGQVISGCTQNVAVSILTLRAEGETELVADASTAAGSCTNTVVTSGVVTAALTLPVTSKTLSGNQLQNVVPATTPPTPVPFTGNSDAVLILTPAAGAAQYFPGNVNGTAVSFNIPCTGGAGPTCIPAGTFTLTVTNIRVNAFGATGQVNETILLSYSGANNQSLSTSIPPEGVGFVLPSLSAAYITGQQIGPYTICSGNSLTGAGGVNAPPSFTLTIKEAANAFKLQSGASSEQGSFPFNYPVGPLTAANAPLLAQTGTGTATQATQINIALGNLPTGTGTTVYAPISVVSGGTTLTLVGSPAVATAPPAAVSQNLVALTPANGALNVTYAPSIITSTGTSFNVPIFVTFGPNTAAVQGPITALVSYAPAVAITGPATQIPTFGVSAGTPLNAQTIVACSTTLIFPYVTNSSGFETGIAIANTTTDNLGTTAARPSNATPVNGICTMNFYGSVAQPTAVTFPGPTTNPSTGLMGAYSATATPPNSPVVTGVLTTMLGTSNPTGGFTGYAIAQCNFTDAHGFAFILDASGTPGATGPEGYVAVVVPGTRGESTGNTGE